jgi:LacI family transcriptional regulator
MNIPKRHSLVVETAQALRSGIEERVWVESLPGERILCKQLHVSRPTLRLAFTLLEKEGMISVSPGIHRRIMSAPARSLHAGQKVLGIIAAQPMNQVARIPGEMILEMRYQLSQSGFDSEVNVAPHGDFKPHRRKLEHFIREHGIFCCILMLSSKELQSWFHENGIPAFVLGSTHPTVPLPSLDVDYYAVCHHAAGLFLGRGHRHLVMLLQEGNIAGDLASERGFIDGVSQSAHPDVRCTIIHHTGETQDICRKLDRLFDRPNPPTALLVCKPLETLISFTHLLNRGIKLPGQASLISRDRDYIFEHLHPTLAHYSFPTEAFSQRLIRLMLQLVEDGSLPPKRHLLMPLFIPGETLGPGPAAT